MGRRAFAVAVVVGCASPAASHFQSYVSQTSGSADATQFELQPSGSGLAFAIAFPNSGDQMPSSLSAAGMELLMGTTPATCSDTAGIGVGIVGVTKAVPQSLGGSDLSGPPGPATFVAGDAIVQATIPWSTSYACDGGTGLAQVMSGASTITVFPSGRIVRTDEMVQGTNNAAGPANCGCQGDNSIGNFEFLTFWGFALGSSDVDANDVTAHDGEALGCTTYPGLTLGVAFGDTQTRHDHNDFSVYAHDFQAGGPALGSATVASYASAMQIAPAALCADTVPLLADNPLILDGQTTIGTDIYGIYEVAGPVDRELDFTSGSATIPPGFALELALGDHARIDINGDATAFATQPGSNGTVLYIAAGLDPGETLSVTPE